MPLSVSELPWDKNWTLFLDRDGVINKKLDNDYVKSVSEFEFLPGSLDALARLSPLFKTVIIVTNQQGVGKGVMSEKDLNEIHETMLHRVRLHGGRIDAVYYAPWLKQQNHPERKPGIGMAEKAKRDFPHIDFKKSIMAGDSLSDVEFGKLAGMHTVLLGTKVEAVADRQPEFVFPTLDAFAQAMLEAFANRG